MENIYTYLLLWFNYVYSYYIVTVIIRSKHACSINLVRSKGGFGIPIV
jgi:hypothetical protein